LILYHKKLLINKPCAIDRWNMNLCSSTLEYTTNWNSLLLRKSFQYRNFIESILGGRIYYEE
jgi:hypothetical protein